MRHLSKLRLFSTTALMFVLLNNISSVRINWHAIEAGENGIELTGDRAQAKRSGGRSGGGSMKRSSGSSGSRSSGSRSNGSRSSGSSSRSSLRSPSRSTRSGSHYRSGPHIEIEFDDDDDDDDDYGRERYGNSGENSSGDELLGVLLLLLIFGGGAALVAYLIWRSRRGTSQAVAGKTQDLQNDIVTVTQLQVAVREQPELQSQLSELSLQADTRTSAGLVELLRESALVLLRSPEYWAYVRTRSQTVKTREAAAQLFQQISIEERSKVDIETLVNIGGKVKGSGAIDRSDDEPGYIVVTWLIGTEHDRPLLEPNLHTSEQLQAALQKLASLSEDYLLILELAWTPQTPSESLDSDALLLAYPDFIPI